MSKKLEGKVALVTGASRGIGRAIAVRLAEDGATVLVHYGKGAQAAEEVASGIRTSGGTAFVLGADLSTSAGVTELVSGVAKTLGQNGTGTKLDILVNNAGIAVFAPSAAYTPESIDESFAVNVRAPLLLAGRLGSAMAERGHGSIIMISSVTTSHSVPYAALYAATKSALNGMTKALAGEFGHSGVRVNAVRPGIVATDMGRFVTDDPAGLATYNAQTPLGRVAQPTDVADLVVFLAGPGSVYVTAEDILVDGGWSAQRMA